MDVSCGRRLEIGGVLYRDALQRQKLVSSGTKSLLTVQSLDGILKREEGLFTHLEHSAAQQRSR